MSRKSAGVKTLPRPPVRARFKIRSGTEDGAAFICQKIADIFLTFKAPPSPLPQSRPPASRLCRQRRPTKGGARPPHDKAVADRALGEAFVEPGERILRAATQKPYQAMTPPSSAPPQHPLRQKRRLPVEEW
jgi:hypothetical protein